MTKKTKQKPRAQTADELINDMADMDHEEEFFLSNGKPIILRRYGAMAAVMINSAMGLKLEETQELATHPETILPTILKNLDKIAEEILPEIVADPVIVPTTAGRSDGVALASDIPKADQYAIIQHLWAVAGGETKKAKGFRDDPAGPKDSASGSGE